MFFCTIQRKLFFTFFPLLKPNSQKKKRLFSLYVSQRFKNNLLVSPMAQRTVFFSSFFFKKQFLVFGRGVFRNSCMTFLQNCCFDSLGLVTTSRTLDIPLSGGKWTQELVEIKALFLLPSPSKKKCAYRGKKTLVIGGVLFASLKKKIFIFLRSR